MKIMLKKLGYSKKEIDLFISKYNEKELCVWYDCFQSISYLEVISMVNELLKPINIFNSTLVENNNNVNVPF